MSDDVRDYLMQLEKRKAAEQLWFEVTKERDELQATLSAVTDERNQLQSTLTRERKENSRTLKALYSECDQLRTLEASHVVRIDGLRRELDGLKPGPCPGEDMRDHVSAMSQARGNQPPPTRIPAYCLHDWRDSIDWRGAPIRGQNRCVLCASTQHVGEEIAAGSPTVEADAAMAEDLAGLRQTEPVRQHQRIVLLGKLVPGGAPDRGIVECRRCKCLLLESRETCLRCPGEVPF